MRLQRRISLAVLVFGVTVLLQGRGYGDELGGFSVPGVQGQKPLSPEPTPPARDIHRSIKPKPHPEPPAPKPADNAGDAAPTAVQTPAPVAFMAPEMVAIPNRSFEIGKYTVTFAEWDACLADGGCNGYRPDDQGWGRGRQPVINVSWNDVQAYLQWLNHRTGKVYRLPTEAEWEYAAGGGTADDYWWGSEVGDNNANCKSCGSRWDGKMTAPVGSFRPNAFGLYEVLGNVWQMCQDCYQSSCDERTVRGGSWDKKPSHMTLSFRGKMDPNYRNSNTGFRLVRTVAAAPTPVAWLDGEQGKPLPVGAVVGGVEDGHDLYICRAPFNGGVHPGNVVDGHCNIGWGGQGYPLPRYQVLTAPGPGPAGDWVAQTTGLTGAFVAGQENGGPLYLCQAHYQDSGLLGRIDHGTHTGKVINGKCNVEWGGREQVIETFSLFHLRHP